MALGMKQNAVLDAGRTTHYPGDAMMKAPPGERSDFGVAHRAEAALLHPKKANKARTPKRVPHMIRFALFEVGFICGIVGVRVAFDLDMSTDGSVTGRQEPYFEWPLLVIVHFAGEDPISSPALFKIFLFDPVRVLLGVSSSGPSPEPREDFVIRAIERAFTHDMPMIIRPTSYLGVEFVDQFGGRPTPGGFDGFTDVVQEGFNVLLGRLDEQFSIGIPAHVLSEKIKALFHVRDDCLRRRKFKPPFAQELFDRGFDFSFQ